MRRSAVLLALLLVLAPLTQAPTALADHSTYILAPSTFNGGTAGWTNHDGSPGATDALTSNNRYARTTTAGNSLRFVMADLSGDLSSGVVGSVVVRVEGHIGAFVDDAWTVRAYVGSGTNLVYGPQDRAGSSTDVVRTWDITSARAWTVADLNALEIQVTTKATGTPDGTWRIDVVQVVAAVNRPPVAVDATYTVLEDHSVTALLAGSDPDVGDTIAFGLEQDGVLGSAVVTNASTGAFTYTPLADAFGPDPVLFFVTDGELATVGTATINIAPVNDEPSFTAGPDVDVQEDAGPQSIPGWATDIVLGPANEAGQTPSFPAFNDNEPLFPVDGQPEVLADGTLRFTPAPDQNGRAIFFVRIQDDGGTSNGGDDQSDLQSIRIRVLAVNDAPRPAADAYAADEDGLLTVPAPGVLGNDVEVEGEPMTAVLESGPSHGALTFAADGSFEYEPDPDFFGVDSFTYRATDGAAPSAPALVTLAVTGSPDAPVAFDADLVTQEDEPLEVTLLAADPDGQELTYEILDAPDDGTLQGTAPDLTYVPTPAFFGTDAFTFRVSDGALTSNVATVSITVQPFNDPPVATPGTVDLTIDEDDPAVFTFDLDDPEGDAAFLLVQSAPQRGHVAIDGARFTYTPDPNVNGADAFVLRATDGSAQSGDIPVSVTIRPLADEPLSDNDGDGVPNLVEWAAPSDHEDPLRTPLETLAAGNVLLNGGFELGLAGWLPVAAGPGESFETAPRSVNVFDAAIGGLPSGGAVELFNQNGDPDLRLLQTFASAGVPGPLGGTALWVDVVSSSGGVPAVLVCHADTLCADASKVPLHHGRNRIDLGDRTGQRLVEVSLYAPADPGSRAMFDNVRIEGATLT